MFIKPCLIIRIDRSEHAIEPQAHRHIRTQALSDLVIAMHLVCQRNIWFCDVHVHGIKRSFHIIRFFFKNAFRSVVDM